MNTMERENYRAECLEAVSELARLALEDERDDAREHLRRLRGAVGALPDVMMEDVSCNVIPTYKLIENIQACRALLP